MCIQFARTLADNNKKKNTNTQKIQSDSAWSQKMSVCVQVSKKNIFRVLSSSSFLSIWIYLSTRYKNRRTNEEQQRRKKELIEIVQAIFCVWVARYISIPRRLQQQRTLHKFLHESILRWNVYVYTRLSCTRLCFWMWFCYCCSFFLFILALAILTLVVDILNVRKRRFFLNFSEIFINCWCSRWKFEKKIALQLSNVNKKTVIRHTNVNVHTRTQTTYVNW